MATSMNIGGQDDEFNRYKMPSMIAKVEGRGNGIKTRLVNCFEVARALHRPPGYVCKFFGCELGAQTKIDDNEGIYIVNGSFQQDVLQEVLKKFIAMFVLCQSCNLPETDLKLRKNGSITQACNACGAENPCDMTHKLCTYIINNPPDGKKKNKNGKKDKAARRAAKAAAAAEKSSSTSNKNNSNSPTENGNGFHHEDVLPQEEEEVIDMVGDFNINNDIDNFQTADFADNDDDVEWSVDTSKEAEEARKRELGAAASILERGMQNGTDNNNASVSNGGDELSSYTVDDEKDKFEKLRKYIEEGKKPLKVLSKSEKIFGEDDAIRGIMMAAVINETLAGIPGSIKQRSVPIFKYLGTPMNSDAQQAFLEFLDWVGRIDNGKYLSVVPHMLKVMWDADVLEESEIFSWFNQVNGPNDVRKSVKVIIDWLQQDDDDEDDDDDDEDEDSDEDED